MTLTAFCLVVLAALAHASWNLLAKRSAKVGPLFVFAYNLVSVIAYGPWVITLLAQGKVSWSMTGLSFMLLSGFLHLAYSLALQRGYQLADLSVVYPVARGAGPMLSTLGAILLLGERPSGLGVIGLVLVVCGILLIATQGRIAAFLRPEAQAGLRWGAGTGGLIASYTLVDAFAVKALGIAPVVLDWFANLLRFCLLLPVVLANPRRAMAAMRGHWLTALGVGLLSPLSYILVLGALRDGAPVSLVAPLREMSMMLGALMGLLILREAVGPWRLLGCAILSAGVVLLSTS